MPTRILRDTILTSPSLARCSDGAQYRWPRYTLAADDYGCFETELAALLGRLYPRLPSMTVDQIASDLTEYAREGMLELWEDNGRQYGFFVSWGRHQRIREAGKWKSRRKTPIPPSAQPFASMAAYYKADADRAFARRATGVGEVQQDRGPEPLPDIARNCLPKPQSKAQSKSKAQPKEEREKPAAEAEGTQGSGSGIPGQHPLPDNPPTGDLVLYLRRCWPEIPEPDRAAQAWLEAYPDLDLLAEAKAARKYANESGERLVVPGRFVRKWLERAQREAFAKRSGPVVPNGVQTRAALAALDTPPPTAAEIEHVKGMVAASLQRMGQRPRAKT